MTDTQHTADLRAQIARTLVRYEWNAGLSGRDTPSVHHYGQADAVLAVASATDRTAEERAEQAEAERDNAYRERAQLAAYLAALHPSHIGPTDPAAPDWPVLIVETPAGQMSWHIAPRDVELFAHVTPTNRICRDWDGHNTEEKYERLRQLTAAAEPLPLFPEDTRTRQALEVAQLRGQVDAARRFAEDMHDFCSPHGVSVGYADRLVEAMDRAKEKA